MVAGGSCQNGGQLTERETEARGIRSGRMPAEPLALPVPPPPPTAPSGAMPALSRVPSALAWLLSGPSPPPLLATEVGATFPGVFIAWQPLGSLVSEHATIFGGIRSQELSGQSLFRLWCLLGPSCQGGVVRGPCPSLCADPSPDGAGGWVRGSAYCQGLSPTLTGEGSRVCIRAPKEAGAQLSSSPLQLHPTESLTPSPSISSPDSSTLAHAGKLGPGPHHHQGASTQK